MLFTIGESIGRDSLKLFLSLGRSYHHTIRYENYNQSTPIFETNGGFCFLIIAAAM